MSNPKYHFMKALIQYSIKYHGISWIKKMLENIYIFKISLSNEHDESILSVWQIDACTSISGGLAGDYRLK